MTDLMSGLRELLNCFISQLVVQQQNGESQNSKAEVLKRLLPAFQELRHLKGLAPAVLAAELAPLHAEQIFATLLSSQHKE
jgi:hypothetical protein